MKVVPLEQERQGTSWTIDTVRHVTQKYPNIDFTWIIGSDVLDELDQWKEFDQLQDLISFLVVPRADYRRGTNTQQDRVSHLWEENPGLQRLQEQCEALERQGIRFPNISSSLVRERVKRHHPIHHLVSRRVEEYIYSHNLYADPRSTSNA